jgi:hypothetical protein
MYKYFTYTNTIQTIAMQWLALCSKEVSNSSLSLMTDCSNMIVCDFPQFLLTNAIFSEIFEILIVLSSVMLHLTVR